jgi:protease-4
MEKEKRNKIILLVLVGTYFLALLVGITILIAPRSDRAVTSGVDKYKLRTGVSPTAVVGMVEKIVVVEIEGVIQFGGYGFRGTDAMSVVRRLNEYSRCPDIKAIILRINSPGGTVGAVQEIYREVMRLREQGKYFVASLGDIATSGGYYVASAANKIVANPGTITGSIGVLYEFGSAEELFKKLGIKFNVVKSGRHKDIGSFARTPDKEELQILQNVVDETYNQFISDVSRGRDIPKEELLQYSDGRIFTGTQALSLKLVDTLGNFNDAVRLAEGEGGFKTKPKVIYSKDTLGRFLSFFVPQEQKARDYFQPFQIFFLPQYILVSKGLY